MKYLFFDVETTGLWRRDLEATDKNQPRIVQIAAQLTDEKEKVHGQLACIVQPDGWKIPKEASDIHKITDRYEKNLRMFGTTVERTRECLQKISERYLIHNQRY